MARINVTLPDKLLEQIDVVAAEDYATRSEILRQAVLLYLRLSTSTLALADRQLLLKSVKNRELRAYLNKAIKGRNKK